MPKKPTPEIDGGTETLLPAAASDVAELASVVDEVASAGVTVEL